MTRVPGYKTASVIELNKTGIGIIATAGEFDDWRKRFLNKPIESCLWSVLCVSTSTAQISRSPSGEQRATKIGREIDNLLFRPGRSGGAQLGRVRSTATDGEQVSALFKKKGGFVSPVGLE